MKSGPDAVSAHLDSLLTFPRLQLTPKDERAIRADRSDWIVRHLLLKRYRRAPVHPDTLADVQRKVALSLSSNEPIYIIVCFGGYKHFWNPSHPYVDFAELFNLNFMARYLAPILLVHKPGIILEYEAEDIVIPLIDNYPEERLDAYAASFRALIREYVRRSKCPDNFRIRYFRTQEEEPYKSQNYTKRLFERITELRGKKEAEWKLLSKKEQADRLHRTPRSIMWAGRTDLTHLSNAEREAKMIESKILNETYYDADFEFKLDYFTGGTHIPVVQTWGLSSENTGHWLVLASTDSSTVDFWIGRGILERDSSRAFDRVVSHRQYDAVRSVLFRQPGYSWAGDVLGLQNLKEVEVVERSAFDAAVAQLESARLVGGRS
jgi:hypothetical protein